MLFGMDETGERVDRMTQRGQCNEWETETKRPISVEVSCVDEDDDENAHRWRQSDWQPVVDAVTTWARTKKAVNP